MVRPRQEKLGWHQKDPWLLPLRAVVEVIGLKTVRLECKHVRKVEREVEARVLLRSSLPCRACGEGK